jgi:serine phosphatase RsbU (regulator of sigma subunit)
MLWGLSQALLFGTIATDSNLPGIPNLFEKWQNLLFPVSAVGQFIVITAIIALLLRDQRQVALDRASFAGEIQAAQEIQRALVPASIDALPGLDIGIAFFPAREVGGDFYSCRILPGNRQRILLGDVSGKGAAAAMTAAVLLGAAQRHEVDSPVEILCHLNIVMTQMRLGGFATCICAELSADGRVTFANAGHLSPYRNGAEVQCEPGLPLGMTPDAEYSQLAMRLAPDDRLTFLSDGVVEARNATGELFGFERTRAISTESAPKVAEAAQAFGQGDDITVLTLTFAPVAVAHA